MTEVEATVDTRYLSAGANRYSAVADWGVGGKGGNDDALMAFGADSNVCLWNPAVRIKQ